MRTQLKLAIGLAVALVVAAWTGATLRADSCQAFTAYGDCYIELTGCSGGCTYDPGQGGEGSLEGTDCTGASGSCVGDWYYELAMSGSTWASVHVFRDPLIN